MVTEEDLNNAVFTVLASPEYGPIEYSRSGIYYLLKEVKKLLPDTKATITCQDIEEMTKQDRRERKAPKFYVSYDG